MYVNTLITLQENLSTYGIDGKKITGHVTITSPGLVKCYVQNLKKQASGQTYALYAFSKAKDKGVRLGNLGSEKETKWIVNAKNIGDSGITLEELDGVAIVVEDEMRGVNTVLMGYKNNRYMIIPLIDDVFKKIRPNPRPGNPPPRPGQGPGNPPPRPGQGPGNPPPRPGQGPGNPPPRPNEGPGNPPPRPGQGPGNPPPRPGQGPGNPPPRPNEGPGNPPPRPGQGPGNPPPRPGQGPGNPPPRPGQGPGNPPPRPGQGPGNPPPRPQPKTGMMIEPDPLIQGPGPVILPGEEVGLGNSIEGLGPVIFSEEEIEPKNLLEEQGLTKEKILNTGGNTANQEQKTQAVDDELLKIAERLKQIGEQSGEKQEMSLKDSLITKDRNEESKRSKDEDEIAKELQRIINLLKENQELKQKTRGIEEQIEKMQRLPQTHKLVQKSDLEKTLESRYMAQQLTGEEQEDDIEKEILGTSPKEALNFMSLEKQGVATEKNIHPIYNKMENQQVQDISCQNETDYINEMDRRIKEIELRRKQQENN